LIFALLLKKAKQLFVAKAKAALLWGKSESLISEKLQPCRKVAGKSFVYFT
jgi:hypothetical protein